MVVVSGAEPEFQGVVIFRGVVGFLGLGGDVGGAGGRAEPEGGEEEASQRGLAEELEDFVAAFLVEHGFRFLGTEANGVALGKHGLDFRRRAATEPALDEAAGGFEEIRFVGGLGFFHFAKLRDLCVAAGILPKARGEAHPEGLGDEGKCEQSAGGVAEPGGEWR